MRSMEDQQAQQERLVALHKMRTQREILIMLAVLDYKLQETKDRLVECQPSEMAAYQGEARAYNRLMKIIMLGQADIQPKEKPYNAA